jgi:prophage regulatory protein
MTEHRLQRFVRKGDLPDYVGLRRTTIEELIKQGRFPKPIKLTERAVAWSEQELIEWQQERIAARDRDGETPNQAND